MHAPDNLLPAPLQAAPLPEVTNHTPWPSQYFQHVDPFGEVFHVMVCRITYSLKDLAAVAGGLPVPTVLPPEAQTPLCEADQFRAAVNASCLIQESDYAPYKPRCDVLVVNAQAYSPDGQPRERWQVGLGFAESILKVFQVTGPRALKEGLLGWQVGAPAAVDRIALNHEWAFGGPNVLVARELLTRLAAEPALSAAERQQVERAQAQLPEPDGQNPIGCGRNPQPLLQALQPVRSLLAERLGIAWPRVQSSFSAAPQIELPDQPFAGQSDYPVLGFGPIGRWWQPRLQRAGTHDDHWKATQWPKSPQDHDYRYWNCAPDDQQIPYPQGGEAVALAQLLPHERGGSLRFALPRQDLQLLVRLQAGPLLFAPMHIDTVIIDPEAATLSLVRRATVGAGADVRALELGTWPPGTRATLKPERPHGR
jgi:hypothetical protein